MKTKKTRTRARSGGKTHISGIGGVETRCHLEPLPFFWADARVLTRHRLLSHWATREGGSQAWSGTVVVRRTADTAVNGHSSSRRPIGSLRTRDWSEAPQRTVETYKDKFDMVMIKMYLESLCTIYNSRWTIVV